MSCVTPGNSLHPSDSQFLIWKMNSLDQVISVISFNSPMLCYEAECQPDVGILWNVVKLPVKPGAPQSRESAYNGIMSLLWQSGQKPGWNLEFWRSITHSWEEKEPVACSLSLLSFQERSWVIIVCSVFRTNFVRKKTEIYKLNKPQLLLYITYSKWNLTI